MATLQCLGGGGARHQALAMEYPTVGGGGGCRRRCKLMSCMRWWSDRVSTGTGGCADTPATSAHLGLGCGSYAVAGGMLGVVEDPRECHDGRYPRPGCRWSHTPGRASTPVSTRNHAVPGAPGALSSAMWAGQGPRTRRGWPDASARGASTCGGAGTPCTPMVGPGLGAGSHARRRPSVRSRKVAGEGDEAAGRTTGRAGDAGSSRLTGGDRAAGSPLGPGAAGDAARGGVLGAVTDLPLGLFGPAAASTAANTGTAA